MSAHGGCEALCLLFWKEAWLKKVEGPGNAAATARPMSVPRLPAVSEMAITLIGPPPGRAACPRAPEAGVRVRLSRSAPSCVPYTSYASEAQPVPRVPAVRAIGGAHALAWMPTITEERHGSAGVPRATRGLGGL